MFSLGIFGGKYMTDCQDEFTKSWYTNAKFCSKFHDPALNDFNGIAVIFMGRRHPDDQRQIKRWLAIKRHIAQIKYNCCSGDLNCRPRQRQAVLDWVYNSRKI